MKGFFILFLISSYPGFFYNLILFSYNIKKPPTEGELTVTSGFLGRITSKWKNDSSVS